MRFEVTFCFLLNTEKKNCNFAKTNVQKYAFNNIQFVKNMPLLKGRQKKSYSPFIESCFDFLISKLKNQLQELYQFVCQHKQKCKALTMNSNGNGYTYTATVHPTNLKYLLMQ